MTTSLGAADGVNGDGTAATDMRILDERLTMSAQRRGKTVTVRRGEADGSLAFTSGEYYTKSWSRWRFERAKKSRERVRILETSDPCCRAKPVCGRLGRFPRRTHFPRA